MLSLKTSSSLSQGATNSPTSFHHHEPGLVGMAPAPLPPPPTLVEDDDDIGAVVDHQLTAMAISSSTVDPASSCDGSCESLVDSMRSSSTTTTSTSGDTGKSHSSASMQSTSSSHGGGLMKRASMKSSYALTSLLTQTQREARAIANDGGDNHGSTSQVAAALVAEAGSAITPITPSEFGHRLQLAIHQGQGATVSGEDNLNFHDNRNIRQALELPLRQARTMRDSHRRATSTLLDLDGSGHQHSSPTTSASNLLPLSSWVGLPYASLREERPFLYDHMHTHPLNELLAQTLNLQENLSQLHQGWNPHKESAKDHQRRIFAPLLNRTQRQVFQEAYDSFVTSCCLPLLHATALRGGVFNSSNRQHHTVHNDPVIYRYQVFPTINVAYPNDAEACKPPSCDLSEGKSVGWLHFHVPLTASQGTSALYCEHFPGREDWHALRCAQVGLGYCWDGARCLSFVPLNTTHETRVSLDFRILLVRASNASKSDRSLPSLLSLRQSTGSAIMDDDTLCRPQHLKDALTRVPGFYKEATMDHFTPPTPTGMNKNNDNGVAMHMVEPDARCGFPFA